MKLLSGVTNLSFVETSLIGKTLSLYWGRAISMGRKVPRRRLAVAALGLLTAQPAVASFEFGVGTHLGQSIYPVQQAFDLLSKVHAQSFRDELFWRRVEEKKGAFSVPRSLSQFDRALRRAKDSGFSPLLIINYANPHYDQGNLPHSEEGIDGFARYAADTVKRYTGVIDRFEVWNEWNIGLGSPKRPRPAGSADGYVQLLRAASKAMRDESKTVKVVGGAVAGLDYKWIERFGQAGGFAHIDAFSIHPYVHMPRKMPEDSIEGLGRVRNIIDRFSGGRRIPMLVTEMGWPTGSNRYGVSEQHQEAYLLRFLLMARAQPLLEGVWWYTLKDYGDNDRDFEQRFGLFRRDGEARPTVAAAAFIAPLLSDASDAQVTEIGENVRVAELGFKDGRTLVAFWVATDDPRVRARCRVLPETNLRPAWGTDQASTVRVVSSLDVGMSPSMWWGRLAGKPDISCASVGN